MILSRTDLRRKIRRREFDLIAAAIKDLVPNELIGHLKLLEFGSGPASGAEYLCQLGKLVASDIYEPPFLNLPAGVEFKIVDIHRTNFDDGEFDILISNQVLEYLDLQKAFKEMKKTMIPF